MANRLAGELERHFQRSYFQRDADLVFCHPATGRPYDRLELKTGRAAPAAREKLAEAGRLFAALEAGDLDTDATMTRVRHLLRGL
jgi:hypothetical protein